MLRPRALLASLVLAALLAPPAALASPCLRPSPECSGVLVAEADLSAPLLDVRADRRVQVAWSLGWLFRLRAPWSLGPIASLGYESESGMLAAGGLRLRRDVGARSFVDLTAAARVIAADRAATRSGAGSLELAYSWADWIGAGVRVEVARLGDRLAPSVFGTVRLGSYAGLAVGGTSVLLVLLLQNIAITS